MSTKAQTRDLQPPAHPGSVSRDQMMAAVRSLGLEPELIGSVHLTPHEIVVETWLYDFSYDPPARRLNESGEGYQTHEMRVPVVGDSAASEGA